MTSAARTFVAGATGYVGRSVVAALRDRGVETVAHVRPDSSRLAEWTAHFGELGATVDSTPWDAAAMTARLRQLQPTVVFALLGTTKARAQEAARSGAAVADYDTVDYGLSTLLLQAAQGCQPAPKYVYLSAAGVSEGTGNAYLAARVRLERELRASGVHFIIARPAFITGDDREENRPVERISARLGDMALAVAATFGARSLQQRWASLTGPALAESLVRLGLDPAAVNLVVHADGLRGAPPKSGR
jgi:uncharacterized protein YbjT (DUF2867 family)